jgi:iron(III) transport system ATP-binding protein
LDEPFSGLDGPLKAEVRDICISQLRASGVATLLVTHDPLEALQVADRLALMSDGGLLQVDTPEGCYRRPASAIAARLLGAANAVPAHLSAGVAHTPLGDFPAPHHLNGAGSVIIRPEDVQLFDHAQSGRHPARITNRRYLGAYEEFALRLGSIDLLVRAAAGESPVSTDVYVQIEANRVWSCAV